MDLAISNVIQISVSQPGVGLGEYNTSNIALFSREAFNPFTFGNAGFKIYKSPTAVGIDFGTNSSTFAMANAIFSQTPNILANGGYLVIIPFLSAAQTAVQNINFPGVPASGTFELHYGADTTTALSWNASAATIQTALRLLTGLSSVVVTGSIASQNLVVTFTGVSGPAALLTILANSLADASSNAITPVVTNVVIGSSNETIDQAILRTENLVQYFAIMSAEVPATNIMLLAAAEVQALNKMIMFVSYTAADLDPGGMLDLLRSGGFTHSRGLFYGDTLATALIMMAAYSGRAYSTNFNGSLTTQNMQLKTLNGVQPDPSSNLQNVYNAAQLAGADMYASIGGVPKVLASGANDFFDNVYNLQWFVGALQVELFNILAETSTKIPQTEGGMTTLKNGVRTVCEQGITNQFLAPGVWTSPDTFGNQQDFYANIAQRGYYIYSQPVAQQLPAARAARDATLMQVALKYAGAIDSSAVIVNVNP